MAQNRMMTPPDLVVGIVALNGGRVVGKTRLQKTAYLLDRLGMRSGFEFEYHNFGPFSYELADAANEAIFEGRLYAEQKQGFYQIPYSEFTTTEPVPNSIGALSPEAARTALQTMEKFSAIELELAATIAFLKEEGVPLKNVGEHVQLLKPQKASAERLEKAEKLLIELDL